MNSDTSETVIQPSQSHTISRRSLVRTGVTAAWSVPLIQVVTAGAAAASTPSPTLTFYPAPSRVWTGNGNGNTTLQVNFTLQNMGTGPTSDIQVTLVFADWSVSLPSSGKPSGWTTPTTSGKSWTFTAVGQILSGGNKTFSATFDPGRKQTDSSATLTANYNPGGQSTSFGKMTL